MLPERNRVLVEDKYQVKSVNEMEVGEFGEITSSPNSELIGLIVMRPYEGRGHPPLQLIDLSSGATWSGDTPPNFKVRILTDIRITRLHQ